MNKNGKLCRPRTICRGTHGRLLINVPMLGYIALSAFKFAIKESVIINQTRLEDHKDYIWLQSLVEQDELTAQDARVIIN